MKCHTPRSSPARFDAEVRRVLDSDDTSRTCAAHARHLAALWREAGETEIAGRYEALAKRMEAESGDTALDGAGEDIDHA